VGNEDVTLVHGDLPPDLARTLAEQRRIAWDTETTGLDSRKDALATCQLFSPPTGGIVIQKIDEHPPYLSHLLADADVVKVFHHAPFDLRFMKRAWNVDPGAIRCTKVASKLLEPAAPNAEHSLARLLQRHLGVVLDKGPVRTSAWDSPVLTAEQLTYAVNDVRFLLPLEAALATKLAASSRGLLYEKCCAFIPARVELELGNFPDVFAY
jgi:ribonuclease D